MKKSLMKKTVFWFLLFMLMFPFTAMSQSVTLVTVGDSLTAGDGDDPGGGGYPARLLNFLNHEYPGSTLTNLAISGDTTTDLINKQLDNAVNTLAGAPADTLKTVLVWIGSNDLFGLYAGDVCTEYYPNLDTCEETEMGYSAGNLQTILSRLGGTGATVYIALLDDQSRRPVITDPGLRGDAFPGITADEILRMSAQIGWFNERIQTEADRISARTVDFFHTTIFETAATLDDDGNHPNSAGYDAIAGIWYEAVTGSDTPPDDPGNSGNDPVLYVSSGGTLGTLTAHTGETITLSVSLDPGDLAGQPGDWWLACVTADGLLFSLNGSLTWVAGMAPILSTPLFSLKTTPVFSLTPATPITFTVYFVVDTQADGVLAAPYYLDTLEVQITDADTNTGSGGNESRLQPENLVYQGAFLFPDGDAWAYSGHALAFYPTGDTAGPNDGYPGSLYAAAHAHQDLAGEMSIPAPVMAAAINDLPRAGVLRSPMDITGGWKDNCTYHPGCIYRELDGLAYLPENGKIAWNLRNWYNTARYDQDSLGWSDTDMTDPRGVWHIGPRNREDDLCHNARTSNYLFTAPKSATTAWLDGKYLIAGGTREAGALGGSQGPALFALAPWKDGNPPSASAELDALPLLYYPEIIPCVWQNGDADIIDPGGSDSCVYPEYQATDQWNGGAWIETETGHTVLIVGTKGMGDNCYDTAEACADPCSESKGYHAYPYQPQILFYDPEELEEVATGSRQPWEVFPYRIMNIESVSFEKECAVIGAAAWDPENGNLYVTEKEINDPDAGIWGATAVHVWKVD